jgi:lipopolysaccharide/colanic/teichoic acid biosynthesis glycosyltransferase
MYAGSSVKRGFDLAGTIPGLAVFGPVAFLIAVLIFAEERKSIFFVQERVGRRGQKFRVLKFRTMTDGKITRVGSWLRRTGLDELPQYLNILTGDMSVVGPRPLTQLDIERLGWQDKSQRWEMKPGLTGLAQVRSGRGAAASLEADLEYLTKASLLLDIKIILISFVMNIVGKRRAQRLLGI